MLLLAGGIQLDRPELVQAGILGLANAAVGAALYLGVAALVRTVVRSLRRP